jgi:hypothetical protein
MKFCTSRLLINFGPIYSDLSFSRWQLDHHQRTQCLVVSLKAMIKSQHRAQHSPRTGYTKHSIHRVQHTPSTAYSQYSTHPVYHPLRTAYTTYCFIPRSTASHSTPLSELSGNHVTVNFLCSQNYQSTNE